MRIFLMLAIMMCLPSILFAGMFSWTDQSGNVIFGDSPPQGVSSKPLELPKLTVLEGFGNRYNNEPQSISRQEKRRALPKQAEKVIYKNLRIIAPKQGQVIRANDGDVSVALSLSPKLRPGDKIVISLDGKELQKGTLRVANMTNLDRGEHLLTVSVVDKTSKQLIASKGVKFTVLRASSLHKKSDKDQDLE